MRRPADAFHDPSARRIALAAFACAFLGCALGAGGCSTCPRSAGAHPPAAVRSTGAAAQTADSASRSPGTASGADAATALRTTAAAAPPSSARAPAAASPAPAAPPSPGQRALTFEEYDPPSTLVVPETLVTRARYPFVDVHSHQWDMPGQDLDALVAAMDALNMAVMVNLSGRHGPDPGEHLRASLQRVAAEHPTRFLVFTNLSYEGIDEPAWGDAMARRVAEDVAAGAAGLKVYKRLGLSVRDGSGARVPVDDPRLDPIWRTCGELGVPVLIHTGDPAPFWQPADASNERWLELQEKPERRRDPAVDPSWEQLMAEQRAVFARHPGTTFISAHLGWMGNDLARLGRVLDEHPNVLTEIGAVLAELGRQPRVAREWFVRHQDRVLFGKDAWAPDEYHVYFRALETADDSFDYYRRRHAFWKIYGLELPDEVLRKLYYGNALRLFPQLDRSLFPAD